MLKKNETVTLEITALTNEGNGVGRYEGMAVFVPFSAIGDKLKVKIVKVLKSYAYGIIEEIINPSIGRITPDCNVFKKCGGCALRHISYEEELSAKHTFVKDAFERIGGLMIPEFQIFGTSSTEYRNKAQYPLREMNGKVVSGFYSKRSHRVVRSDRCLLLPKLFDKIAESVCNEANALGISAYDETTGRGILRHIYIRRGFHSGELMLCIVATADDKRLHKLFDRLLARFDITTAIININPVDTNVVLGKKNIIVSGSGFITDTMLDKKFLISPHSFYQVNTEQAEKLYRKAGEYASLLADDTLLDLYCGVGTIGITLADGAKKLIGAEVIEQAVKNARENAGLNGIKNAEFLAGDAGKIAAELLEKGERPDVIIADPARKGCDKAALDAMIEMNPKRVVMVSCNPATAARDIKYLTDSGYELKEMSAFDLFPRTPHVECVCLIVRK